MTRVLTPMLLLIVAILAVALFLRGSEVMFAISSVNSSYALLNLTNAPPNVTNVRCYDALSWSQSTVTLIGGGSKEVLCNGTVEDYNGAADVTSVVGSLVTSSNNCTHEDNLNCYMNTSCAFISLNSTFKNMECRFWLRYNAYNTTKSGTWTGNITVGDSGSAYRNGTAAINVSELLAIGVNNILAFGGHSIGSNDSVVGTGACAACAHPVYNYGNVRIDILLNATNFTPGAVGICTQLVNGYLHVNNTDASSYALSYPLTGNPADSATAFSGFNLAANVTGGIPNSQMTVPTTGYTYWGIGVPAGVSGSCQATIWFTAVAG